MIKGAIFDMDGTLLDSMHIWATTGQEYLQRRGIVPVHGDSDSLMYQGWQGIASHYQTAYGITDTAETIVSDILELVKERYAASAVPLDGAVDFLKMLKKHGVKITLATATDRCIVEPTLKGLGMWELFDGVFTCGELKTSKLSPLIYDTAREFMGTETHETWVFEDALYAAKTAKAAGYALCGVRDRFERRTEELKALADVYINDYSEVQKTSFGKC